MIPVCLNQWLALVGAVLVLLMWDDTKADTNFDDEVPHRTSDDIYMNPCKARKFSGDIALSDEEIIHYDRSIRHRRSAIATKMKDDMKVISKQHEYIAGLAKARKEAFYDLCLHNDTMTSKMCQHTRNDVIDIKKRWKRLNLKLRDLQTETRALNSIPLDQIMKTPHSRRRRAATAIRDRLWRYGVVPYEIGGNFSASTKSLFQLAMRHWENHTCITFRERKPSDINYITFTVQECGCCSYVGVKGRGQAISIGKNCDKFGIVVHELGHVIGFWHEHTRPDRDEFVQILRSNIKPGQEYNFDKMTYADIDSLGETYDYNSIMHYSRNTFSKQHFMDTLLPRSKPGVAVLPEIGQRIKLSEGDIRQANKLYKCPLCGRTLQDSRAEFSHVPTHRKSEACQWRISATHGEKIILNITMLGLPRHHARCAEEYLEVRDGIYARSPLLGRFCDDITKPKILESSGTRMWIEFKTRSGYGSGFKANYETMCGGEIRQDDGFLTSPNFPDGYRSNKNCVWRLTARRGYTMALKFQTFEIEKHDACAYDYLEIRDGPDETSKLIGNYCGYKLPDDIKSTGRDLYVKFVSDANVQKGGFYAIFTREIDECSTSDHGCDHECENTLGSYKCSCRVGYELHTDGRRCQVACGGVLEEANGTISSPSYPDLYPQNKKCVWEIVAPDIHKIHLNFTHFDLEGSNQECEFDSVRVSSGVGKQAKLHGVFCGSSLPSTVTSLRNKLHIEFNSDSSVQKTGFKATYQIDKDECAVKNGGCQHICKNTVGSYYCECQPDYVLHDDKHGCKEGGCNYYIQTPKGEIQSPNYPDDYPSRKDCSWQFSTLPGHRIRLSFKTFELEPHLDCTYDHVAIYDGDDKEDLRLAKMCGTPVKPKPVISTANEMLMIFFSDVSVERKGFDIAHDTVCGGDLFASTTSQYFVSHTRFGDFNYDNNAHCKWTIYGKRGKSLILEFSEFNVEDESQCRYDVVEIHGKSKGHNDHMIGSYCGDKVPKPLKTQYESIVIHFHSDDTIATKGFMFSFQIEEPVEDNGRRAENLYPNNT